jgi:brefeldin A-resistance guanine nucleotide exchange factor 1
VLINILDPNDKLHTDSTRLVSMRILNTAFEVCGSNIGEFPSLAALISDHGCKFLFQLARSDNPSVAQLALRTITTVFETLRKQLKLQQELFLAFTIDRLTPPAGTQPPPTAFSNRLAAGASRGHTPLPGSPRVGSAPDGRIAPAPDSPAPHKPTALPAKGETREMLLETLTQLSSHPSFFVDLYMNYDCDINCEDIFGRLMEFLSQVSSLRKL